MSVLSWRGVRARRLAVAAAVLALGPAAAARAATPAGATLAGGSCGWAMYGHDPARTMTTSCPSAPTPTTVADLRLAWRYPTVDVVTAMPTVAGGVVYAGDWSGHFYAIDLATGKLEWSTVLGPDRTDGQADHHSGAYGTITSTAAVATVDGRRTVFVGAGDSVYALDATTRPIPDPERVLWRTDLDPTHPTSPGEIESSPVIWAAAPGGPVLFVGSDANQDSGYTGEGVWALRAESGQVLWHFNPETSDPAGYPPGTHPALYGCGNVWSSPALGLDPANPDPKRRAVLYFGTADCPDNGQTACPSDGSDPGCPQGQSYDYADRWSRDAQSMMAVSALDGTRLWSYQAYPQPVSNDDDYGASAQLFTISGGEEVVGEASKDGTYVVIDRATGQPVWRRAEAGNGNLQTGFALGGFIGSTAVIELDGRPRVFGGSAIDTPVTYNAAGQTTLQTPATEVKNLEAMQAFSGDSGRPAWWAPMLYTYGSTTAAAGVVYVPSLDGFLRAFDAASGRLLWAFPLVAPSSSGAAIVAHGLVVGDGTDESDVEFKACDRLPDPALASSCRATPLDQTLNPLSDTGAIYAFTDGG
jgi:polyvinyl alcohol dehydrogenase (cytochrome)